MEVSTWLYILVSVIFGFTGIAYFYFNHAFQYWKKKGIKFIKPVFPFGSFKEFILFKKPLGDVYVDHYLDLKGEKFGGVYMAHTPQLMLRDPEIIKSFLVKDFEHFHDHGFASDQKIDPLSGNLFQLNGEKWKDMRNKLSPTFTSGKMKMMFQTLAECGKELKAYLKTPAENEEILDVKEVMAKFTTDIIASCAFGIQSNCLKNPDAEFRHFGKRIFEMNWEGIVRQMMYLVMPTVAIKLKISSTPRDVEKFFLSMVRDTLGYREKNNIQRKDFLQLLMQMKNQMAGDGKTKFQDGKDGLTTEEIAAQVFVFLIGGFETSSVTLTYCLYELAINPHIQERLRNEMESVLEKHGGTVTYEALQEMSYLDKVLSETLRKYPPAPFLLRECTKEYKIPGTDVTIDRGIQVVIPVEALHLDPLYFPEPDKFDPERFRDEIKNKRHHYTYLPFGEGPRICIGMRFAQMQTKIGLVSLLSNYDFNVCSKTPIPLVKDPKQFFNNASGIFLQIKSRS